MGDLFSFLGPKRHSNILAWEAVNLKLSKAPAVGGLDSALKPTTRALDVDTYLHQPPSQNSSERKKISKLPNKRPEFPEAQNEDLLHRGELHLTGFKR